MALAKTMEDKISLKAVEKYSATFAQVSGEKFFDQKQRISGPEIMKFSTIQQVNLFILRELWNLWHEELARIKSPYFDYQAKAVQESLKNMQNALSNNISISKSDFIGLLQKAVARTIFVVLDPYDFYSGVLDQDGSEYIKVNELKNEIRFLKVNRAPLEKLVAKLNELNRDILPAREVFAILDHILEEVNFSPEEIDGYLAEFSKVTPVSLNSFYGAKSPPSKSATKAGVGASKNMGGQPILYDELAKESRPTLADGFQKQKISRIHESLTINQKFMFTKMLFNGDFELFSKAIEHIDRLDSINKAISYLEDTYPAWNKDSEEFAEFFSVLEKRFA